MIKVKAFFKRLGFIIYFIRTKFSFLIYRIKNKNFKKYKLTDKGFHMVDYLLKLLNDNTYTYSSYEELQFYNLINEKAEKRNVSKEIIAYELLSIIAIAGS